MRTLDGITVSVPEFSAGPEWDDAEDEVEPAEVPILHVQKILAALLEEVRPPQDYPVPTLLGWLLLWTRVFQGLEGLRGAAVRRSLYSARILSRALFETTIHLRAIARNLTDTSSPWPTSLKVNTVIDRLNAYVAWSIYHDLQEWKFFLRPANLSAVYDPRPAREFAKEHGGIVQAAGALFNEIETLTDAEAEAERGQGEKVARKRIAQYEEWLLDERLAPHVHRLRTEKHRTLTGFLDSREQSVKGALDADGMPYAYSAYARGSAVIHGTTLEGILAGGGGTYSPQIWSSEDDIASAVSSGLNDARNATLGLFIIRPAYLATAGGS